MQSDTDPFGLADILGYQRPYLEDTSEIQQATAHIPVEALAAVVLDPGATSSHRWGAAAALRGRIPVELAESLTNAAIDSGGRCNDTLVTALDESGPKTQAILRRRMREFENFYAVEQVGAAQLQENAEAGDRIALGLLAVLGTSPWSHHKSKAENALADVVRQRGGVLGAIGQLGYESVEQMAFAGGSPADRLWGMRLLHEAGADIAACLQDESELIRWSAHKLLRSGPIDAERLWSIVGDGGAGSLCALATLAHRGFDVRAALEQLGSPWVVVEELSDELRKAIVREYVPRAQPGTDPRWLTEHSLLPERPERDDSTEVLYDDTDLSAQAADWIHRGHRALVDIGVDPEEPTEIGVWEGSGNGTFYVIRTRSDEVTISTLLPVFRIWHWHTDAISDEASIDAALTASGLARLDAAVGEVVVTGLNVYFFGRRGPLPVKDLLFYWQD